MGANKNDTIILKANKSYYDRLHPDHREQFEIMSVHLSGFEYELDTLHQEIKQRADELGKPYFKAKKELRKRENELRTIKLNK
mgnify:CR=1 FL=1